MSVSSTNSLFSGPTKSKSSTTTEELADKPVIEDTEATILLKSEVSMPGGRKKEREGMKDGEGGVGMGGKRNNGRKEVEGEGREEMEGERRQGKG